MIKKKVQRRIQNPAKHLRWRFLQVCLRCSGKNIFLKISQNLHKSTCANLFFNKVASLSPQPHQKGPLAQVFFCEFCEICKNTFFIENLWMTPSAVCLIVLFSSALVIQFEPAVLRKQKFNCFAKEIYS